MIWIGHGLIAWQRLRSARWGRRLTSPMAHFFYHDISIPFPKAWGKEEDYVRTLDVGRLKFYRPV
jgi:hypothetical protein